MQKGKTIDQLEIGEKDSMRKTSTESDVYSFAQISGDTNPLHIDKEYASESLFKEPVVHGMLTAGLISAVIGTRLPGVGTIYLSQSLRFTAPVKFGDTIEAEIEVVAKLEDKINLLGVCQGGTFSVMYAALYPEKLRNLVVMVAPIDFHTDDGLLHVWAKELPIDNMVDTLGVIPGDIMNVGFVMLKPFQLMLDKYMGLIENCDKKEVVENFLRMEKWIFDSPGQAGEAIRQFVNDLYKNNLLIKNKLKIGEQPVDLRRINMPLLNIFAEEDHLVPPSASKPLNDAVSSKDKSFFSLRGGYIGIYMSSQSQTELAPAVAEWITLRS